MPRKVKQEEHENHERWLVSYADFITLLFAFFVVMYSVSSVNEGKFRVLSESMEASFRSSNKSMSPIQIGRVVRKPHEGSSHAPVKMVSLGLSNMPPPRFSEPVKVAKSTASGSQRSNQKGNGKGHAAQYKKKIEDASRKIKEALLPLIKKGLVNVKLGSKWIVVDINSSILFPSGGAHLARQAVPVLERIASILKPLSSSIQVEGFTDNIPIQNLVYPSNWELSAARAASVVHLFTKVGVNPVRMAAIGYGEFQPVASNKTVRGRQKNRRVVLRVNTSSDKRFKQLVKRSIPPKAKVTVSKANTLKKKKNKIVNVKGATLKVIRVKERIKVRTTQLSDKANRTNVAKRKDVKKRSSRFIRPVIKPIVLPGINTRAPAGSSKPATKSVHRVAPKSAVSRTSNRSVRTNLKRVIKPVRAETSMRVSKPEPKVAPTQKIKTGATVLPKLAEPDASAERTRVPVREGNDASKSNFDLNNVPVGLPPLR